MGIIFNAVGAIICALTIAFLAGWKLSFVVLCFTPLMVFSGMLQGKRMNQTKKQKQKKTTNLSWAEKGGMVKIYLLSFIINKNSYYLSLLQKQLIVFEQ
jgi:membrane protein implicated in regulation of membrane protease activity